MGWGGVGARVYAAGARVYAAGARVYAAGARVYASLVIIVSAQGPNPSFFLFWGDFYLTWGPVGTRTWTRA